MLRLAGVRVERPMQCLTNGQDKDTEEQRKERSGQHSMPVCREFPHGSQAIHLREANSAESVRSGNGHFCKWLAGLGFLKTKKAAG